MPSPGGVLMTSLRILGPLEVWQGAATLEISLEDYLRRLRGLGLAPGVHAALTEE